MATNATFPPYNGLVTCVTGTDQEYRLQSLTSAVLLNVIGGTVDMKDAAGTVFTLPVGLFPLETQALRRAMLVFNGATGVTVQVMEVISNPVG